jgi:hypothetical protein
MTEILSENPMIVIRSGNIITIQVTCPDVYEAMTAYGTIKRDMDSGKGMALLIEAPQQKVAAK